MEGENRYAYAQEPGGDGSLLFEALSSPPHKGEKNKKKKKSKHPEGKGNSAHSPDCEHHVSSLRMDEEGEDKSPKKRKAKKKSKEDREHRSSQKSRTEEAGTIEARILGGSMEGNHRQSGPHNRADVDVEMNTRKPASVYQVYSTRMRKESDENYYEDEDVEEDFKCPPQYVPWSNPNEELTRHKPATSHERKHHHYKHEHEHHKHERQSSMEGSKRHTINRVDEGLEEIKCPPQRVPWSNPNEEWASRKPATSHKHHHHHHHHKHEDQDEEAAAMEEGFPFEEKEEIQETNSSQNSVAEEGIGIEDQDTSGGQAVVPPSRRTDISTGTEALGTGGNHPTEGRRTRFPERIFPGAYREGGRDNEDEGYNEDELTVQSYAEPPIPPTLSAEPVNTAEEERRVQEKVDRALQRERELIQDQIDQALQRELRQVVVAEIIPEVISKRGRRWKLVGAFLLVVLIVVGVVLGIALRPEQELSPEPSPPPTFSPDYLRDLLSSVSYEGGKALQNNSTPQYKAFDWLATKNTNLENYTNETIIQRYALATLYYSTNGDNWAHSDFWLSDADVCGQWYQFEDTTINCTNDGAVAHLDISRNNLQGPIPPEIGFLSHSLEYFRFAYNELENTIPREIGELTKLTLIDLGVNNLTGTIPNISALTNLGVFQLAANELTGTIFPSELSNLSNLYWIGLNHNMLMGTIPSEEIKSMTSLNGLFLYGNMLTGNYTCPDSITYCFISCGDETLACRSL